MFAAVLGIISNVTFGTANVFYYAYLPLLADAHPTVRKLKSEIERELYQIDISSQHNPLNAAAAPAQVAVAHAVEHDMHVVQLQDSSANAALQRSPSELDLAREEAKQRLYVTREGVSNTISTHAFSVSYTSGVLSLLLTGGFLFLTQSTSSYMMQICVAFIGAWWYGPTMRVACPRFIYSHFL
jgi:hypothetical protein